MRFMILMKANADSEAGVMPSQAELEAMGAFNEEMMRSGVLLAGEGLHPTSRGARVRFDASGSRVIDGPFAETKELVAGFWMIQARDMDEALEWARRCPNPDGGEFELEVRQVFEADDFGEAFTPELRAQEDRLRAEIEARRD
jgi:hypothetical protein